MMAPATLALVLVLAACEEKEQRELIDFEEIELGSQGYRNGSDGSGGFRSGNGFFVNSYNHEWSSWSGFACSSHTDVTTAGPGNMYSSIAGSGADNSDKFAVYNYFSGQPDTLWFEIPQKITRISVSNSTYAYLTMHNGDPFAKKFGGDSGSDPDWFRLVLTAINADGDPFASAEIYLADFRFDNNTLDYISNVWTDIDLSQIGFVKGLVFEIESSDTGQYGINTPAYVCVDNIEGILLTPDE